MTRIMLPASVVQVLRHPELDASAFAPTRFTPASTKAWFARHTLHFMASDCPRHQFTRRFYSQLVHCFSMAPHYGPRGFWTEHFATTRGKVEFIEQVLRDPGSGTPNHAWHDVEREISRRLRQSGLLDLCRQHAAGEQDAAGRAELARLTAKHGQRSSAIGSGPMRAMPARVPQHRDKGNQLALGL